MVGRLIASAVCAAVAGVWLAFGTVEFLEAGGPAEREEATVETRNYDRSITTGLRYELVLRTASGERLETSGSDVHLDLPPGKQVRLEVSEIGRSVQAVEADGHRAATGNSPSGSAVVVLVIEAALLLLTLAVAAVAGRPALAALSATAGFVAGALPVWLLF